MDIRTNYLCNTVHIRLHSCGNPAIVESVPEVLTQASRPLPQDYDSYHGIPTISITMQLSILNHVTHAVG